MDALVRFQILALVAVLLGPGPVYGPVHGLVGFGAPAVAHAESAVPQLTGRVVDRAGIFSTEQRVELNDQLASVEAEQGAQIAVLTVETTAPETIEASSHRVASAWKLGREGVDDGILLVVAVRDRAFRIEVGYGLEGAVPDVVAKRLIEEYAIPQFRVLLYFEGVTQTVEWLSKLIRGESLPAPTPPEDYSFAFPLIIIATSIGSLIDRAMGKLWGILVGGGFAFLIAYFFSSALLGLGIALLVILFVVSEAFAGTGGSAGGYRIGGGRSSGSGGFSGGGGSFGGGGASGRW